MATPKITEDTLSVPKDAQNAPSDEQMEGIIEKVATDPNSLSDGERENFMGWKKRKTIERLNAEKKIRMIIPFQVGEDKNNKANWYHPFGINGVFINVRKGVYVEVPESIFILYQDSIKEATPEESQAAANEMRNIDMKFDPVTNQRKSKEYLS